MKILAVLVIVAGFGLALFISNPSRTDVDVEIQNQLLARIDGLEATADQDPVIQPIFTTCKFGHSACASFIKSLMNVSYENKTLYSKVTVSFGNEDPIQCYGALRRVICPGL